MDSVPLVCISGQVPTHLIGTDAFQECDTTGITRPCTKHNWLVKDVNDLARVLHLAKCKTLARSLTSLTNQLCFVQGRVIPVVSHS